MSIMGWLFGTGGKADKRVVGTVSGLVRMSSIWLRVDGVSWMSNTKQRDIIAAYFFGYVDAMGHACRLSEAERLASAREVFRLGFRMNRTQVEETIASVVANSRSEEGRRYMREGANALIAFMEGATIRPNDTELVCLLAEAGAIE
jgi:hypothetical protein